MALRDDEWTSRSVTLVRLSVELQLPEAALDDQPARHTIDEVTAALAVGGDVARECLRDYGQWKPRVLH